MKTGARNLIIGFAIAVFLLLAITGGSYWLYTLWVDDLRTTIGTEMDAERKQERDKQSARRKRIQETKLNTEIRFGKKFSTAARRYGGSLGLHPAHSAYKVERFDEAVELLTALLATELQHEPSRPEVLSVIHNDLGLSLAAIGEHKKALAHYQADLKISLEHFGPTHRDLGTTYFNIGLAYQQLEDHSQAIENFTLAHVVWRGELGPDHHHTRNAKHAMEAPENNPDGE